MVCDSCQFGKSCKLPFASSDFVSSSPLERIHCDLWGPSPVVSTQGFKYYVIFIDNHSRFTWLYPLRLKSEFASVFSRFQQLVVTGTETVPEPKLSQISNNCHNCLNRATHDQGSFKEVHLNNHKELWHETNFHRRPAQPFITGAWNYRKSSRRKKL